MVGSDAFSMRDRNDRGAGQPLDERLVELFFQLAVERTGRLVYEKKIRASQNCSGRGYTLLLPGGEDTAPRHVTMQLWREPRETECVQQLDIFRVAVRIGSIGIGHQARKRPVGHEIALWQERDLGAFG